jgi:hypothetical protein
VKSGERTGQRPAGGHDELNERDMKMRNGISERKKGKVE